MAGWDSTVSGAVAPAAIPAPRARLTVVFPRELRAAVDLGSDALAVGRQAGDGVGLRVDHATVSRRHFEVAWDARAGRHVGRDLGSHNGSSVDGARLGDAVPLADNAVVRLGDALLVYECGQSLATVEAGRVSREAVPGDAGATRALRAAMERAAADAAPALLVGETGTGKEWIARELHRLSGRGGPLVAINCAALAPTVVESELFGHARGAFTGAVEARAGFFRAAHGGSLFLDEIGELPLDLQPKLLRVLQEGEVQPVGSVQRTRVDVRVIAATHRDLAEAAEQGRFRADLYARLSLWELPVPSLRARRVDILPWMERLAARWRADGGGGDFALTADAAEALVTHRWPLNLRGLERAVRELAALGGPVARAALPTWLTAAPAAAPVDDGRPPVPTREQFAAAFAELKGSVSGLARRFRRDRRQIYRWIEAYGLRR